MLRPLVTILIPVVILVVVLAVAAVIGGMLRSGSTDVLSSRLVLRAYLHFASAATTLVVTVGLISLCTAALTIPAGRQFSYVLGVPSPASAAPSTGGPERAGRDPELQRQDRARTDAQFNDDLIRGVTVSFVGLLLWAVHAIGLRRVETEEERRQSWINRLHRLGLLAVFGVGSLVALPFAAYELLRYLVGGDALSHTPPGSSVALALVLVPIWCYELWQVVHTFGGPPTLAATG